MRVLRLAAVGLFVLSLTIGAARALPPVAPWSGHPAVDPGGPNASCMMPWGVDLCALGGVTTTATFPDWLGGSPIEVGNWWTPMVVWGTNAKGGIPGYPIAYHDGYVTAFPDDPMRDFMSKLVAFRVIVDPGTPGERIYDYTEPLRIARVTTIEDYFGPGGYFGFTDLNPMAWVTFFPMFHPLSAGMHGLYLVWSMSAEHCDGIPSLGGEPLTFEGGHCIPAGDTYWVPDIHPSYVFQVVAR